MLPKVPLHDLVFFYGETLTHERKYLCLFTFCLFIFVRFGSTDQSLPK